MLLTVTNVLIPCGIAILLLSTNVRSDRVESALNTSWSSERILIVTAGNCELTNVVIYCTADFLCFGRVNGQMDWRAVAVFMCIGWLVDPYIAGALDQFTKMVDAHCDALCE